MSRKRGFCSSVPLMAGLVERHSYQVYGGEIWQGIVKCFKHLLDNDTWYPMIPNSWSEYSRAGSKPSSHVDFFSSRTSSAQSLTQRITAIIASHKMCRHTRANIPTHDLPFPRFHHPPAPTTQFPLSDAEFKILCLLP